MARIVRLAVATVFGAVVGSVVPLSTLPENGHLRNAVVRGQQAEPFQWRGRVATGHSVEIKGVNGSISAQPASGDSVEVVARKTGRKSNPGTVRIEVVEHEGGVTLCAVYPNADGPPNECRPGKAGRMSTRDNDVKVDFEVRVPPGVAFVARTVNGAVEAHGIDGNVSAHTVNGSVKVKARGVVDAETVNGSIQADLGEASWDGTLEFQTVNGSIEVGLPADASTRVAAQTVNGDLQSDFPVTVQGRFGPKKFEGTIGAGGRDLKLETVNGRITLRRTTTG